MKYEIKLGMWFAMPIVTISMVLTLALSTTSGCGFTNYKNQNGGSTTSSTATPPTNPPSTSSSNPGGSGDTSTPPTSATVTFQQVNQQILQPKCVSCHSSGSSPDFSSYAAFATNTGAVVPGNPDQSAMYTAAKSGSMPRGGTALTQAELTLMYDWIQQGAQNN